MRSPKVKRRSRRTHRQPKKKKKLPATKHTHLRMQDTKPGSQRARVRRGEKKSRRARVQEKSRKTQARGRSRRAPVIACTTNTGKLVGGSAELNWPKLSLPNNPQIRSSFLLLPLQPRAARMLHLAPGQRRNGRRPKATARDRRPPGRRTLPCAV